MYEKNYILHTVQNICRLIHLSDVVEVKSLGFHANEMML